MSFKRTKVVMLPTNEKATIGDLVISSKSNRLGFYDSDKAHAESIGLITWNKQYLYFYSDDEIKKGDWFINRRNSQISQCLGIEYFNKVNEKKIIATTDKTLIFMRTELIPDVFWHKDGNIFPQPSEGFIQKFIDAYNSGDPITEVMVEYNHIQSTTDLNEEWLKVNSSDYKITIRKMKDSWTREEVVSLCREAVSYNFNIQGSLFEKWIEENI